MNSSRTWLTRVGIVLICATILTFAACQQELRQVTRFKTQDQAGTTHLAVLSVGRWDEYREALQPRFAITESMAKTESVPDTAAFMSKVLDLLAVSFRVAAPSISGGQTGSLSNSGSGSTAFSNVGSFTNAVNTATSSASGMTTGGANGATGTTSLSNSGSTGFNLGNIGTVSGGNAGSFSSLNTSSQTFTSGNLANAAAPQVPNMIQNANALPGIGTISMPTAIDPMLRYLASTALYQEVQMLDRYIRDAAIHDGYDPYVVRLQVTLLPSARNAPYDAYSNVSFFWGDFPDQTVALNVTAATQAPNTGNSSFRNVRIIPLLVTDDVEATVSSRSLDQIRQLVLVLQAAYAGATAEAGVNRITDKLEQALGRDFNSTFTIARLSDNTLRVRFGALQQSTAGLAMVPQTHNVSLLLLVPKPPQDPKAVAIDPENDPRLVHVVARTSFVDAFTGKALPVGDAYERTLQETLDRLGIELPDKPAGRKNQLTRELRSLIASNDYDQFKVLWRTGFGTGKQPIGFPDRLWADLAGQRNFSPYTTATLQLPKALKPAIHESLTAISPLVDDATVSKILLSPVANVQPALTSATITVTYKQEDKEQVVALPAVAVASGTKPADLAVSFPSLKGLRITPTKVAFRMHALSPSDPSSMPQLVVAKDDVTYLPPPPAPKPTAQLLLSASSVYTEKGTGTLGIGVFGIQNPEGVSLAIAGADVAKIETKAASTETKAAFTENHGLADVKLSNDATLTYQLGNLNPLMPVTVTLTDLSTKKAIQTVYLPVFQPTEKPKAP